LPDAALGDNFVVGGITGVVDDFRRERPDVRILLTHVCEPTAFGIAELDETGRVVGLAEKSQQPKSDLALVGVYLFTPAVHEAVRSIRPPRRGELEITDALQWLLDQDVGYHIENGTPYARHIPGLARWHVGEVDAADDTAPGDRAVCLREREVLADGRAEGITTEPLVEGAPGSANTWGS
jgi:dTDP-glucose pyrophosphorylase